LNIIKLGRHILAKRMRGGKIFKFSNMGVFDDLEEISIGHTISNIADTPKKRRRIHESECGNSTLQWVSRGKKAFKTIITIDKIPHAGMREVKLTP
jgi:hypothetical protein